MNLTPDDSARRDHGLTDYLKDRLGRLHAGEQRLSILDPEAKTQFSEARRIGILSAAQEALVLGHTFLADALLEVLLERAQSENRQPVDFDKEVYPRVWRMIEGFGSLAEDLQARVLERDPHINPMDLVKAVKLSICTEQEAALALTLVAVNDLKAIKDKLREAGNV